MSTYRSVRHRLSERLELPEDSLGGSYRLQLFDAHAILSGCRKLLKYKSEEIVVLTASGTVSFLGEHLKCKYFFEGTVELTGDFRSIVIERK